MESTGMNSQLLIPPAPPRGMPVLTTGTVQCHLLLGFLSLASISHPTVLPPHLLCPVPFTQLFVYRCRYLEFSDCVEVVSFLVHSPPVVGRLHVATF